MSQEISIFTYHYVRDLVRSRFPAVKGQTIDEFRAQVEYLVNNYKVIRMEEFVSAIRNNRPLPARSALLTFDDGYLDHFNNVFPILDEAGIQGTFFIPMQAIFERKVLDVNKIHLILASSSGGDLVLQAVFKELDKLRPNFNIKSNDFYFSKLAKPGRFDIPDIVCVKQLLQRELEHEVRSRIINVLFEKFVGIVEEVMAQELYMSVEQIQMMIRHGMHIGSHSFSHRWLDSLNERDQRDEIAIALDYLSRLGAARDGWSMCYPYGAYNKMTTRILSETGCAVAFSTIGEVTKFSGRDRYRLPRLDTNQLMEEMHRESEVPAQAPQ